MKTFFFIAFLNSYVISLVKWLKWLMTYFKNIKNYVILGYSFGKPEVTHDAKILFFNWLRAESEIFYNLNEFTHNWRFQKRSINPSKLIRLEFSVAITSSSKSKLNDLSTAEVVSKLINQKTLQCSESNGLTTVWCKFFKWPHCVHESIQDCCVDM